jgi:hypothetical protein
MNVGNAARNGDPAFAEFVGRCLTLVRRKMPLPQLTRGIGELMERISRH